MSAMSPEMIPKADREKDLRTTMEVLITFKMFPKIIRQSKNNELAEKEINEANKLTTSASFEELIKRYSKAVAYAEPGSSSLARAFANRSAVLTNYLFHEDSLKDIDRALEIGYPDQLKAKLYARKAKNLLGLKEMCPEIKKTLIQAKVWCEKMDEDNKKKVLEIVDQLKADGSSKKYIEKWDSSVFLRKTPNDNPKILGASGSIDIRESEEFGRHIVATKDMKVGEVIMAEKLYLLVLGPDYVYRNCSYCGKFIFSGIPCKKCAYFIYCNENCRENAWNKYHEIECDILINILVEHYFVDRQIFQSIRLLAHALKEFGTIDKLYEKIQEIDSTTDLIKKLFTGDVHDGSKYASVYSLFRAESNPPFTVEVTHAIVNILFILSTTTGILEKKYDDLTEVINDKWVFFVGSLLFRHCEIMLTNEYQLPLYDREGNPLENCGWHLTPLKALCNHSCDPNSYTLLLNDVDYLFAIQPIKKGDQIFINYSRIFREMPTRERISFLQKNYKFTCKCIACVNNWGSDTKFPSCMITLRAKNNQDKISNAFDNYKKFMKTIISAIMEQTWDNISSNDFNKSIDDFSTLLNIIGTNNYPSEELIEVKFYFMNILFFIMTNESLKQLRGSLKWNSI